MKSSVTDAQLVLMLSSGRKADRFEQVQTQITNRQTERYHWLLNGLLQHEISGLSDCRTVIFNTHVYKSSETHLYLLCTHLERCFQRTKEVTYQKPNKHYLSMRYLTSTAPFEDAKQEQKLGSREHE